MMSASPMLPAGAKKRFSYRTEGGKYSLKDFMTWRTLAAVGQTFGAAKGRSGAYEARCAADQGNRSCSRSRDMVGSPLASCVAKPNRV
ncbi:hypothetical protein, partial [Mesorhizobium sp. M3A.F.Ca.ET.175.01.1.1]|uniref:hypothetical protein n=1 Tax=Mesorhizobium sp. M3A.F.Ca.ET.175.01.1.1 TaxID=2563945 RepID=UPI001AEDABAC